MDLSDINNVCTIDIYEIRYINGTTIMPTHQEYEHLISLATRNNFLKLVLPNNIEAYINLDNFIKHKLSMYKDGTVTLVFRNNTTIDTVMPFKEWETALNNYKFQRKMEGYFDEP